jgi:TPR repeat/Tetratricopeptide repeat
VTTIQEKLALALRQHQAGHLNEAEQLYRQILQIHPYYADALHLLGVLISQRGRDDLAVSYIERALTVKPNIAAFHNNLGFSYVALSRFEEGIWHFNEALRLEPDFAMAFNNLGKACREQGQVPEAMAFYEKAIALNPDYVEAHFNRAELWLLQGDFERGWPEYEWRWQLPAVARRTDHPPRWDGSPLDGRTILIHTEQGLGDTIHFIRYAPFLKQRGGRVIIHCQAALMRFLETAHGIDSRVAWHSPLPAVDVYEHLLNLPGVFGTRLTTIPAPIPYLQADPGLVASWKKDLATLSGFKIGITWKGSIKNLSDQKRSIPLSSFATLAKVPGVQLINLQKGPGTDQLESAPWHCLTDAQSALTGSQTADGVRQAVARPTIVDFGDRLDGANGAFMDTAAIMMNLDLVISCDTAIPHLAGALGVPVWVALPLAADWRWLLEREDSPWYPTMRLFRQTQYGDWEGVFDRMATALQALIARRAK